MNAHAIRVEGRGVDIAYDGRRVVSGLDIAVPAGRITALVGPNGSGKSTIIRALARLAVPSRGEVFLDGRAIRHLSGRELARRMSLMPQSPFSPDGLTVRELVGYGRFPHRRLMGGASARDVAAVDRAIAMTGLAELADRPVDHLSGGQRQRAWIAMAVAQETETMFLDEPTTFLDMAHQAEVLNLLRRLNRREGRTIVMVLHDLNHAARYADHILALREGRIVSAGHPADIITAGLLREVFGVTARIFTDPATGRPWCIPDAAWTDDGDCRQ